MQAVLQFSNPMFLGLARKKNKILPAYYPHYKHTLQTFSLIETGMWWCTSTILPVYHCVSMGLLASSFEGCIQGFADVMAKNGACEPPLLD